MNNELMAYTYDMPSMRSALGAFIQTIVSEKAFTWLKQQETRFERDKALSIFNLAFTAIPRYIGKATFQPDEQAFQELQLIRNNMHFEGWPADRLARCWWLLHLPATDQNRYIQQVESLFKSAEMNEQVALYGSLPLFAWPEQFRMRAAEGLRTSMSVVFEAVTLDNPYPSEYLDEAAWNQLVLKAFFMDKPVNRIIGLDRRANRNLAHILSDYAHERWAAGRPVNPLLWRPVGPFIDETIIEDIQRLLQSGEDLQMKSAALACAESEYPPSQSLLGKYPELKKQIGSRQLNWDNMAGL